MILRDPIHGLVAFETEEEAIVPALIEAREVQRLRRIRQLGLTHLSYPGADHTRFSHAIGTAHVMKRFIERMRAIHHALPYWQRLTTERARDALAAALLHDIGHGPLSHLFEAALPHGPSHEDYTVRIVSDPTTEVHQILKRYDASLPTRVAELVRGRHPLAYLARAVSGTFDVDRCDYLLRDAHFTGVGYGTFDLDWLLRSFRFGAAATDADAPTLAIDGAKGLPAIESFILARLFMFQQVYFHKAGRASEFMMTRLLTRAHAVLSDGTRLPAAPPALVSIAREGDASLAEYLALDDNVIMTSLQAWRDASDPLIADLSRRLQARHLFKTYELFGDQRERRDEALARAREVASAAGMDPDEYVGLDAASDVPFDDGNDSLTVVFPRGTPRKPGDVSFLLGRLRGEKLERVRLVFAPELREAIVKALAT
ncbi:MAG: HD domain-containing protein [Polyangiaceae bacterium]|nr:HD domain-containing protein [Polyangiaceae bacterium]